MYVMWQRSLTWSRSIKNNECIIPDKDNISKMKNEGKQNEDEISAINSNNTEEMITRSI